MNHASLIGLDLNWCFNREAIHVVLWINNKRANVSMLTYHLYGSADLSCFVGKYKCSPIFSLLRHSPVARFLPDKTVRFLSLAHTDLWISLVAMGRRKSKRKPPPKKKMTGDLESQFTCPFCNHEKSCDVKMYWPNNTCPNTAGKFPLLDSKLSVLNFPLLILSTGREAEILG